MEIMSPQKLATLMGAKDLVYDEALVTLLMAGLEERRLTREVSDRLTDAGYINPDYKNNTFHLTLAARVTLEDVPEWVTWRARVLQEEATAERERKAEEEADEARNLAAAFLDRGWLIIAGGVYRNTPNGWARAREWLRIEMESRFSNGYLSSATGDFEGVEVGNEHETLTGTGITRSYWRRAKKRILASLTNDERRLFGLPPAKPLSVKETKIKNGILHILTDGRGAVSSKTR